MRRRPITASRKSRHARPHAFSSRGLMLAFELASCSLISQGKKLLLPEEPTVLAARFLVRLLPPELPSGFSIFRLKARSRLRNRYGRKHAAQMSPIANL